MVTTDMVITDVVIADMVTTDMVIAEGGCSQQVHGRFPFRC
jgi:hypothetical protein